MATQQESVFWNLVALAIQEYGYSPSIPLEWDAQSQTYRLHVHRLGVHHSERGFTIFENQFLESVANGRLHEGVMRNLLDAVVTPIPGAAWKQARDSFNTMSVVLKWCGGGQN